MKRINVTLSALALGSIIPLLAQTTTEKTTDVTRNGDGSVTKTETKTTTFNPQVRTKVVKYFDKYKTEKYGLPPAWGARVKVKEVPAAWRTSIAPGLVITEEHRPHLVEAPPELVSELPPAEGGVRYYVAGSNVVAVDSRYQVVDSVQIPSIKFTMD